jgi:hypothetical protein
MDSQRNSVGCNPPVLTPEQEKLARIDRNVKMMRARQEELDRRFPYRGSVPGRPSRVTVGDLIKALRKFPPEADLVLCDMNAGGYLPIANIDLEGLRLLEVDHRSFPQSFRAQGGRTNAVSFGFWNEGLFEIEFEEDEAAEVRS